MYRHLDDGWVVRESDGALIPPDPDNRDRIELLAWQGRGGVVSPRLVSNPDSVTLRQFKHALTRKGLRDHVEAEISSSDQDIKDWWDSSSTIRRLDPVMIAVANAVGKKMGDLDDIFRLAASL